MVCERSSELKRRWRRISPQFSFRLQSEMRWKCTCGRGRHDLRLMEQEGKKKKKGTRGCGTRPQSKKKWFKEEVKVQPEVHSRVASYMKYIHAPELKCDKNRVLNLERTMEGNHTMKQETQSTVDLYSRVEFHCVAQELDTVMEKHWVSLWSIIKTWRVMQHTSVCKGVVASTCHFLFGLLSVLHH